MSETLLMRQIWDAVCKQRAFSCWRNNCGVDTTNGVRYGLGVGSADLVGFRHSDGKFCAIEVKTKTGRVRKEQKLWIDYVNKNGGNAGIARSVEDALEIIDRP